VLPDDLGLLLVPGVPSLSPDGSLAVVVAVGPDLEADEYAGQLWSVPTDGSTPARRLSRGRRDTDPAHSPDGRLIAFLRTEPGGRPQLHVMAAAGGEPMRLTAPLGTGAACWSPDGSRLAYCARVPEPGRYGTAEGVGPEAEPPRLVTTLQYREDDIGFLADRPSQVFTVSVPDLDATLPTAEMAAAQQMTTGDADATDVTWSPDGQLLAFVSARHEGRDSDLRTDVWTCAPDGSALRQSTDTSLSVATPAFSPDGASLWFLGSDLGQDGLDFVARNTGLWWVPVAGGTRPVRVTDPASVDLQPGRGAITPTGDGVLVQRLDRGAVHLIRVAADGAQETLVGGDRVVLAHATGQSGRVVAAVADPVSVGELLLVGAGRRLTDFGAALRTSGLLPPRELTVAADDGYPVHGWVVLPPGDGPHPVLLTIHGGPYAQYGWGLFDEAQVYAAAGYAVLMCNPRGSAGYGEQHGRVILGAMGRRDMADVLAFLDGALDDHALRLDRERVGVQGGSYGGYLTGWLTTHTDRFAAAVVERGFLDPASFVGSSDIGWFFPAGYLGTDPSTVAAQSPMARVEHVRTPTLVVHSEQDWRCPVEQGQRWYVALRLQGVESELLLFPGEGHELSRSGRPRHRRARFEHVLRWWARHLPVS